MKGTHSPAGKSLTADPTPEELSAHLEPLKAHERILQLKEIYGSRLVASSSFGLQASAMLHLIRKHAPDIPIIFVDTGYCFPETYQFSQSFIEDWELEYSCFQPRYFSCSSRSSLW